MNEHASQGYAPQGTGKVMAYSNMSGRWHKVSRIWVRKDPQIYTKWRELDSAAKDAMQ